MAASSSSVSPLRACQVVALINRDTGGPAVTVPRLASLLAGCGVESHLATLDYPELGPQTPISDVRVTSVPAGLLTRRLRGWSPDLAQRLNSLATGGLDLIHSHGLWMFPNLYARQAATRARLPLIISPRGMVEEWSLGRSRMKKFVAWNVFERRNLASARLFHATSAAEASSLRSLGLRQPIAVIPNGIDLPVINTIPARAVLEQKYPALVGRRWLLFLSRVHPKKGVSELLRAWGELAPRFADWHLIVAGPDPDGYGETTRLEALEQGIADRVTFTGMIAGAEKECVLGHADLFVLPTHSENFGIAIAEALAHGVPVITTTGAPWSELRETRSGWWIDLDQQALVGALDSALRLPSSGLREMGARGRALMEQKYSWPGAAQQMFATYLWLCRRGPQPSCVQTA